MRALLEGILEFRRSFRAGHAATFARLAHGQAPDTLAVTCCDSRISPLEFAPAAPGDVFVMRNVGNLVPPRVPEGPGRAPAVPAAVEYALAELPIRDVIVLGHSACGAMRALLAGHVPAGAPHLEAWLELVRGSLADVGPAPAGLSPDDHLSRQNVRRQLENLRTYPAVREGEAAGRLALHGWWFDVGSAEVLDLDEPTGSFVPLDEARIARLLSEPPRSGRR